MAGRLARRTAPKAWSTSARSAAASPGGCRGRLSAPSSSSTYVCRRRCRWEARAALGDWVRTLQQRFPDFGLDWEIYVSAPGAEIEEGHELVRAIDESHTEVYGSAPDRDTVRWFSDASRSPATGSRP